MGAFTDAANTIRQRFNTEFHARRNTPIAFDNFAGLLKSDGSFISKPEDSNGDNVSWVRLSIRSNDAEIATMGGVGNRRFRQSGAMLVQVFVPTGVGDGTVYEIADDVGNAVRGVTVSGVRLKATTPPRFVGPDGAWFQANLSTPFEFDLIA